MKKIIIIICVSFFLTGCNKKENDWETETNMGEIIEIQLYETDSFLKEEKMDKYISIKNKNENNATIEFVKTNLNLVNGQNGNLISAFELKEDYGYHSYSASSDSNTFYELLYINDNTISKSTMYYNLTSEKDFIDCCNHVIALIYATCPDLSKSTLSNLYFNFKETLESKEKEYIYSIDKYDMEFKKSSETEIIFKISYK